jgi:hypothetical protein
MKFTPIKMKKIQFGMSDSKLLLTNELFFLLDLLLYFIFTLYLYLFKLLYFIELFY